MRILFATLWLLVPLGLVGYHYGPGQKHLAVDQSEDFLAQARQSVASQDWGAAIAFYQQALSKLPAEKVTLSQRIRLEIAKAELENAGLIGARQDLASLLADLNNDPTAPAELKEDTIAALANSRYYLTYLMKLEGKPASEWEPEIEAARQEYKLLAQTTADPTRHQHDLEATIRLARAEPSELYGLPLPNQ